MRKMILTFVVGILAGGYKAFVLMLMWNWFVSPVFHTENISFWQTLGLLWVVQLFVGGTSNDSTSEKWLWDNLFLVLDYCVPENKKEELKTAMKDKEESVWGQVAVAIFGQLFGVSVTLLLGLVVHILV